MKSLPCLPKHAREAEARRAGILLEIGWREPRPGVWVNPRTGMATDLQGAIDRETIRGTFISRVNAARRDREKAAGVKRIRRKLQPA